MDMLDFDSETMYFDEPLATEAKKCIDEAADNYGHADAEAKLMRAYFLEPEHPLVLVALYRFFYYQHRLQESLMVANRVLTVFARRLELPNNWQELTETQLNQHANSSMVMVRFYLLCLKGAGFLELRLGNYESARVRLQKVVELDEKDHLGALVLLDLAEEILEQQSAA